MRLPHHLVESLLFQYETVDDLVLSLGSEVTPAEVLDIRRLVALGLPPVISRDVLATIIGVNPGLIWSMERRPRKYYRYFPIKKGVGERHIFAPRVALKIIQKWLSYQFARTYLAPPHVFGFVAGRSHLQAANAHCGARWVHSVDIRDFFPSITANVLSSKLVELGYNDLSSDFITKFCCLNGQLAQGAPTSPTLSNLVFRAMDNRLVEIAERFGARLSRYADDIVFSGTQQFPEDLPACVEEIFVGQPWQLAPEKTETAILPHRLKVHGLLVHGHKIRLTKGYRNRIRAYEHLQANGRIIDEDARRVGGHLMYARQVESFIVPD
ncbi:Retron-type reverse transcriptase [Agrobacterium sp. 719_389]|nr:Retron-type reverse transcriptase [Agrobacterium sp. 719_389]